MTRNIPRNGRVSSFFCVILISILRLYFNGLISRKLESIPGQMNSRPLFRMCESYHWIILRIPIIPAPIIRIPASNDFEKKYTFLGVKICERGIIPRGENVARFLHLYISVGIRNEQVT